MGIASGPNIVFDGLVLCLDAANTRSYPGSGNTWTDLSGNGNNYTIGGSGFTWNSDGYFAMADGGISSNNGQLTTSSSCTCVFWMSANDGQSLFFRGNTGSHYLGAYHSSNYEYYGTCGSPDFRKDTVSMPNIRESMVANDGWHMLEFKNCNFSDTGWTHGFNIYGSYTFSSSSIAMILVYSDNLTSAESIQNYDAHRTRFGL